jgi:hypothetical protein
MKNYLELFLLIMTGWLMSCTGEGCCGSRGPGVLGHMMHCGFGKDSSFQRYSYGQDHENDS